METTETLNDAMATTKAESAIWWSERPIGAPKGLVLLLAGLASALLGLGVATTPLLMGLGVATTPPLVKALLKMIDSKLLF